MTIALSKWTSTLCIYRPGDPQGETRDDYALTEVLNEFGAEGWELVSHQALSSLAFSDYTGEEGAFHPAGSQLRRSGWTFKRRVEG